MEKDPRLVARSETGSGTRRIRPEAAVPLEVDAAARGPRVDTDDLIRTREDEIASGRWWRVRLGGEQLWWDSIGGYTPIDGNAKKWHCRWDAYNDMLREHTSKTWDIEEVPRPPGRTDPDGVHLRDVVQAWTRGVKSAEGRLVPEDGVVHALVGDNVPEWALCGTQVGIWQGDPWPPRGMRRCEKCSSIVTTLPY